MASRTKFREITVVEKGGVFSAFFKRLAGEKLDEYDFDSLSALRKLLSNEKARIINTIKTKNPSSIYELAKILGRDFKSVSEDVKFLENFGFVDMLEEQTGKRERLKPVVVVDTITINVKI